MVYSENIWLEKIWMLHFRTNHWGVWTLFIWNRLYGRFCIFFHFYSEIIMSSVLYHFWLFLSGKSQIVNISSLREIINSFCTYSFSVSANWWFSVCYKLQQHSHLKLFYTLKEGEIWEHWLCYLLHILFAYASCCGVYHTLSTTALKSPATTPDTGEGQAWGGAA